MRKITIKGKTYYMHGDAIIVKINNEFKPIEEVVKSSHKGTDKLLEAVLKT